MRRRSRDTIEAFVSEPPAQMSTTLGLMPINSTGMRRLVDALAAAEQGYPPDNERGPHGIDCAMRAKSCAIVRGPSMTTEPVVTIRQCLPGCRCECATGGACEHVWDGWRDFPDKRGASQFCTRCGVTAMTHDAWVLP